MVKLFGYTVFPLISDRRAYLISDLLEYALIEWRRLKEGGGCFKVRAMNNINFKKPCRFFLPNENEKQNFTLNKPKNIKIVKYQQYFHCSFVYLFHMHFGLTTGRI